MKNFLRIVNSFIFKNKPLYVHYGITHRCNLRCRMCGVYCDVGDDKELSLEQIEEKFDILQRLGVLYVSIGGGEPFLREDLPAVISLLIRKGFMVRLLTNGTFDDESLIENIVSLGLREISISLDTLDSQKQAYICNREGILAKIMQTIGIFSNILPKHRRLLLINTVVSPLNISELPQLIQFARTKGCYISFVPVENHSLLEFEFKQNDHRRIDESYDYLIEMKNKAKSPIFNSSMFLEKSRRYLKSGHADWSCDAGRLYFSLNPQGELSVCHKFQEVIPLLKTDTENIIASEDFEYRRKILIKGCSGCMRPCWAEISFLFRDKRSLYEMFKVRQDLLLSRS